MKLKIEQIAIAVPDVAKAKDLLAKLGITEWTCDTVVAEGRVSFEHDIVNVAELHFNYEALEAKELEILNYKAGAHWLEDLDPSVVSHFGIHVTEEQLAKVKTIMEEESVRIAQEVKTMLHKNE